MWSFELSGGSTFYFDPGQRYQLSALVSYETHTNKEGQDLKPGNILTVEGGLGGKLLGDKLQVRMAYGGPGPPCWYAFRRTRAQKAHNVGWGRSRRSSFTGQLEGPHPKALILIAVRLIVPG